MATTFNLTGKGWAAIHRPAPPENLLGCLDLAILSAQAAWEASKQKGGRPKGDKSKKNESGDAYFLGIVAGLREARVIFNRIESARPAAPGRSGGMLHLREHGG